ncbi:class I SAM-dependent methyltransferase [Streptomyces sp. C10-9-1]|uniref:class I SAM-dependent methyltransferase n=1 Tax=Streptomyces sp. C10-9-1 TaxID=1859285 RepID=UPI0021117E69|nr:class I SAM-dependent methyltransferase [Streptomyces sp. C10-9-1]MCQ6552217.1 class I SAM-dependent methyltransferase [Streptomyces sp. C10-9-1]
MSRVTLESLSYDKAADEYDAYHGGLERGRKAAEDLSPHLLPGPVLDIGLGTALVDVGLRDLGHPVLGVDIAPEMVSRAHDRLGDRVALGDAGALPFASASLPNIVMVHVLHVVDDMERVLTEVARVLQPGGRLVTVHGVPVAEPDDMVAAEAPLDVLKPEVPDTPERLAQSAERCGLRVVKEAAAAPYEITLTPNQYADSIAGRVWSYLKDVDDATWQRLVEPVVADLRALPDPDRERQQTWRVPLSVLSHR